MRLHIIFRPDQVIHISGLIVYQTMKGQENSKIQVFLENQWRMNKKFFSNQFKSVKFLKHRFRGPWRFAIIKKMRKDKQEYQITTTNIKNAQMSISGCRKINIKD